MGRVGPRCDDLCDRVAVRRPVHLVLHGLEEQLGVLGSFSRNCAKKSPIRCIIISTFSRMHGRETPGPLDPRHRATTLGVLCFRGRFAARAALCDG